VEFVIPRLDAGFRTSDSRSADDRN